MRVAGDGDEPDGRGVALVLDIVDSRRHADQRGVLTGVAARVEAVLVGGGAALSAGATVGDEFQALYRADALAAAVLDVARLRLALLTEPPGSEPVRLSVGFGVGEVVGGDGGATAPGQSGSAWWHARTAVERAATRRNAWPVLGWWIEGDDDVSAVRSTLVALDTIAARFDDADRTAARLLLDGVAAVDVADRLGVGQPALSGRLHAHGVYGWVRTLEVLVEGG